MPTSTRVRQILKLRFVLGPISAFTMQRRFAPKVVPNGPETGNIGANRSTLHLELRSVMCNGAEENQAHCCDPYGLRVQEQPLFLVCSRVTIFTPMDQVP